MLFVGFGVVASYFLASGAFAGLETVLVAAQTLVFVFVNPLPSFEQGVVCVEFGPLSFVQVALAASACYLLPVYESLVLLLSFQ